MTLLFSENYVDEPGKRVFKVSMNGEVVVENLDIFAEAGGGFKAWSMTETVAVSGNSLAIVLFHVLENPKISGIKVSAIGSSPVSFQMPSVWPSCAPSQLPSLLPSSEPSTTVPEFEPIYINSGGNADFMDSNGITWTADKNFNTGSTTWTAKNKAGDTRHGR